MIFALCTNPEQKLNKKNQQNRANYPDFRQKTGYLTCWSSTLRFSSSSDPGPLNLFSLPVHAPTGFCFPVTLQNSKVAVWFALWHEYSRVVLSFPQPAFTHSMAAGFFLFGGIFVCRKRFLKHVSLYYGNRNNIFGFHTITMVEMWTLLRHYKASNGIPHS